MATLQIFTKDGMRTVALGASNTLGRHASNSIPIPDRRVSTRHCCIERHGNAWFVRDLGSMNGTLLRGQRLGPEPMPLAPGEEVHLGGPDSTRVVLLEDAAPPAGPWSKAGDSFVIEDAGESGFEAAMVTDPAQMPLRRAPPAPAAPAPAPTTPGNPRLRSIALADEHVTLRDTPRTESAALPISRQAFVPYEQLAGNETQLALDYERLRICYELSRAVASERDTAQVLRTVLDTLRRMVRARSGVVLLLDGTGNLIPGATFSADARASFALSHTVVRRAINKRSAILTADEVQELLTQGLAQQSNSVMAMVRNHRQSALVLPLLHDEQALGAIWLDAFPDSEFSTRDVELATGIADQASLFIHKNLLSRQVEQETLQRERLSRLLSPNLAAEVAAGRLEMRLGGQLVERCTVFNSDIRGFTAMSESTPPQVLLEMLNAYFERMVDVMFRHEGTLDKFMGDGLMGLWGAPVSCEDGERRAVDCALDMIHALAAFNRARERKHLPALRIGIGIHTGPLVAGYVGSPQTLSYTAIGDTVNTSARLCGIATPDQVLVSESTLARTGNAFRARELPAVHLKGKEQALRVFEIQGRK